MSLEEKLLSVFSGASSKFNFNIRFKREDWTKTWQLGLLVAFISTFAFYLPLVGSVLPGHAQWPGNMIMGDQRMFYFPNYIEGYRRFWHGGLLGIDFLVNDGASVFAYRPNAMPFYPPFLISYLLADCSNLTTAIHAYMIVNIIHHFVGSYFTFVFVRRYLGFPTASAVLATTLYFMNAYASGFLGEETFYLQMTLVPVAACALCWLMRSRSVLAPIWVSPVFLTMALSNYGPTMMIAMSTTVVAALLGYGMWVNAPRPRSLTALVRPLASIALGFMVAAPYILAQLLYKKIMQPTADDIDPVAHDLAFRGADLMNSLSQSLDFGRTKFEEQLVLGLAPVFICLFALGVVIERRETIRPKYLWACGVSGAVFLLTLLPTFGTALTAASDAFYYAVPFVGRMHLFQRLLLFSQFFFAIMVSGLATIIATYASPAAKRGAAYVAIAFWLLASIALIYWNPTPTDSSSLLVELFLTALIAVVLAVARFTPALIVVSVLTGIVGLHEDYTIFRIENRLSSWQTEMDPRGAETKSVVDFVKANSGEKALTKVAMATTRIEPYLNRNFPYLHGSEIKLMNYHGYPPHLTNQADYAAEEYKAFGAFDVPWLKTSGLDFIFWEDSMPGQLAPFIAAGYRLGPTLDLPFGNHLSKTSIQAEPTALDLTSPDSKKWPAPFTLDLWTIKDGRLIKGADGKQSQFGYPVRLNPGSTYQVDFDIEAATPGLLRVAMAQKELEVIKAEGRMHFSKRVDVALPGDLWILASPTFSGSVSNIRVKDTTMVAQSAGFDNGLFRYSGQPSAVKAFSTNYATNAKLTIDAPAAGVVSYLLWPNPHMVPFIDGRQVAWANKGERPAKVLVPGGRHTFELRFKSAIGVVFYVGVALYLLLLAAAVGGPYAWPYFERRRRSDGGNPSLDAGGRHA